MKALVYRGPGQKAVEDRPARARAGLILASFLHCKMSYISAITPAWPLGPQGRDAGSLRDVSSEFTIKRVTAPEIRSRKGGAPIVGLTAYHAHTARIIDPYVDMLLVGDLLGMVMHGYETTVPVPLELMIMHAQAVVRGSTRALVVVDMPFGSYEESPASPSAMPRV